MISKDFDIWNREKKKLNARKERIFYHEREIWWCALGTNIGFEQDGTGKNFDRPIVIIKGFSQDVFFAVALTGKKRNGRFYFYIGKVEEEDASAILSQVRLIDTKRLIRKVGTLDAETFIKLKEKLKEVLF